MFTMSKNAVLFNGAALIVVAATTASTAAPRSASRTAANRLASRTCKRGSGARIGDCCRAGASSS